MKIATIFMCTVMFYMTQQFELIDFSNEPYALIPMEIAYLTRANETLLHVFNVTHLEKKFEEYEFLHETTNYFDVENKKIKLLVDKCREYLDQLTVHRNKRGINFLGSIIKFITGTPDHDDMVLVQNKLNDLVENNNRLAIINSKLQQNLDYLTKDSVYHLETLYEWLATELVQIIDTINFAKVGILNTAVLNVQEINQIVKKEKKFEAPLMEILEHATFKILQVNSIYVMLIRYPVIEQKCMLYRIKPIELNMGKLELEEYAMHCDQGYQTVCNCKKFVTTNICEYKEHTCTSDLLNGIKTNCTVIKEHMPSIEQIDDGKILIHGTHKINNLTKTGTFLALFNDSVLIDGQNYTNDKNLISDYLRRNKPSQYEILDIIESQNEELKIPTLTTLEKIPIEFEDHPIRSAIISIIALIIIIVILNYSVKICKIYNNYKLRKNQEKANAHVKSLFEAKLGTISFNRGES